MSPTVLIAPSGFTQSGPARQVIAAVSRRLEDIMPGVAVLAAPMIESGGDVTRALVRATGGRLMPALVTGPVGDPVAGVWGILGGSPQPVAVIDVAAVAGPSLLPPGLTDPMPRTSRGVGELILKVLDHGLRHILIACGDSAINDGGAGMARALGLRFHDAMGDHLPEGGGALARLTRIDFSGLDPRLQSVRIDAAVDWRRTLTGSCGVAGEFGPRNGASPAQVALLDLGMTTYADLIRAETGIEIGAMPGGGSSGGLGAGLMALAGARLHPRDDIICDYAGIDTLLNRADLVVSVPDMGAAACAVARRAGLRGIPVIALRDGLGHGAGQALQQGIAALVPYLVGAAAPQGAPGRGGRPTRPCVIAGPMRQPGPRHSVASG